MFFGNPRLFITQLIAVAITIVYSFIVTAVILKVLDKTVGLRVDDESEVVGLDISQHGESGYSL
ncbi:hypothetical protein JZK55_02700 [Dissulfurispira thermophila]|uniref:Ammonium transporter AmtB-like domain-containing protein n=1 Tax=Dissulfurispira thermophila TaxID=2715679 RepID=A0A7G1GYQ7_9BACT|nr:hypothetical protein JZK55_02700 [Dissulfurispira thermophila]